MTVSAGQPPEGTDPTTDPSFRELPQALDTVITTAVVTAAVVPFVQAVARKAAEGSYDAVRSLVRRMFLDARARNGGTGNPPKPLLIVKNDDPSLKAILYVKPDMTDAAIRALAELDLDGISDKGGRPARLQIFWNEAGTRWQIDRK